MKIINHSLNPKDSESVAKMRNFAAMRKGGFDRAAYDQLVYQEPDPERADSSLQAQSRCHLVGRSDFRFLGDSHLLDSVRRRNSSENSPLVPDRSGNLALTHIRFSFMMASA